MAIITKKKKGKSPFASDERHFLRDKFCSYSHPGLFSQSECSKMATKRPAEVKRHSVVSDLAE